MTDDPPELDPTELPSTEAAPSSPGDPPQIGPYRLLEKIGEGGMGEVWLAEQTEPVKRRAALKVIKAGRDTKQVVARFEAERQALAMMDHPAVAKVFDAGATPQGRHYFAMEHVKGVPITAHCDRHRMSNRQRLELFLEVCEGVQHAHQKAIIHRDLKPSNVLVTEQDGRRLPKIIDFGVAKATAQKLTEKTMFTELGVLIGTPEYMSPEQAELTGEDVDTRTDVYSLGVMLYELLVGALPFDSKELRSGGLEGIRKKILEEEPRKPSTRLSTLGDRSTESARCRRVDLPTLQRQLRGDLDWITMKALDKDRSRRYGSPSELAADIGRHLRHEPVEAGPPSAVYRLGKFVRRHRAVVAVAVAAMLLVIVFAVRERIQSRQIAREREASDRVSEFLADMLGDVDPQALGIALWDDLRERAAEVQRGRGATEVQVEAALESFDQALSGVNATDAALQLLDEQVLARAGETIERELVQEPRIAGRLEHTLGSTYRRLGLYSPAERHSFLAVETRRRALGAEHPDTLRSMNNLALVYAVRRRHADAEQLHRETLRIRRRVLGRQHPETLWSMNNLAVGYQDQARYAEAEMLHRETLEIRRRVLGPEHVDTLWSLTNLAIAEFSRGRYRDAERLYRETLEIRRRVLGPEHPQTLSSMTGLARAYYGQGRYAEAEQLHRETLACRQRVLGRTHPGTLWSMNNLALSYWAQGRYDEAEQLHRETLESQRRVLGREHPDTLVSMNSLGNVYNRQGRYDEAEQLYGEAFESQRRVLGKGHPETLWTLFNLACIDALRGKQEKAMDRLRRAVGAGFAKPEWMTEDADLTTLHGPEYDALVERARENAAARRSDSGVE